MPAGSPTIGPRVEDSDSMLGPCPNDQGAIEYEVLDFSLSWGGSVLRHCPRGGTGAVVIESATVFSNVVVNRASNGSCALCKADSKLSSSCCSRRSSSLPSW
eukprot:scaffold275092_cov37-Tisochrysis_lutea.AAC.3